MEFRWLCTCLLPLPLASHPSNTYFPKASCVLCTLLGTRDTTGIQDPRSHEANILVAKSIAN